MNVFPDIEGLGGGVSLGEVESEIYRRSDGFKSDVDQGDHPESAEMCRRARLFMLLSWIVGTYSPWTA